MQYETLTVSQIETLVSKRIGDYYSGVVSTGATAAAKTLTTVSQDLISRPAESFVPFYLEMTSGAASPSPSGNIRQINDSAIVSSALVLTVINAMDGATTAADTFRVHRFYPSWKIQAIDEALREFSAYIPILFSEYMIVGECLRNRSFEYWRSSSSPYDWETVAGTPAKETTTFYSGSASLKLSGTTTSGSIRQRVQLEALLEGVTLTVKCWVNGKTAAAPKIRITVGSTNSDSGTVSANDTWEELTATAAISNRNQPIYVTLLRATISNSSDAYFDNARLYIPSTDRPSFLPISDYYQQLYQIELGPRSDITGTLTQRFSRHDMPSEIKDGYAWFPSAGGRIRPYAELINQGAEGSLPNLYWVRLLGQGRYPTVSALTDSIDINEESAQLLASIAAIKLIHKCKGGEILADREYWKDVENDLLFEVASLAREVKIAEPEKRLW